MADERDPPGFLGFKILGQTMRNDGNFREIAEGLRKRTITRPDEPDYMVRYYYQDLRPFSKVLLHHLKSSDRDGLHNHPWPFCTFILSGGYWEDTHEGSVWRPPGFYAERDRDWYHRLRVDPEKAGEETWTLFMMGKRVDLPRAESWGFLDKNGEFVPHEKYNG